MLKYIIATLNKHIKVIFFNKNVIKANSINIFNYNGWKKHLEFF